MSVGSLEEIIDDNHAIVSTSVGSEHYVSILSFVDKDQLEPGNCASYVTIVFDSIEGINITTVTSEYIIWDIYIRLFGTIEPQSSCCCWSTIG